MLTNQDRRAILEQVKTSESGDIIAALRGNIIPAIQEQPQQQQPQQQQQQSQAVNIPEQTPQPVTNVDMQTPPTGEEFLVNSFSNNSPKIQDLPTGPAEPQMLKTGGYVEKYPHGGPHDYTPAEASTTAVYRPPNNLQIEEPEVEDESWPTYASWDEGAKANPTSEMWEGKPNPYKAEMKSLINFQNVVTAASLPYAIPAALRLGSTPLIKGMAGTSTLDALGYYGGYHGITHGPEDLNAFIAEPSLETGFNLGMDVLGVAGGAYSTSRLATGIKDAKNVKLLKAAEIETTKTAAAETANKIAIKNKVYTPTTKEKAVLEKIRQKNIDYVKSEEYMTKRMANTGETKESILRQIDEYIEEANRVKVGFKPEHLMDDAVGSYQHSTSLSNPNSAINITNPRGTNRDYTLFEKQYFGANPHTAPTPPKIRISLEQYNTIDHEWKHLFSPAGKWDKSSAIYKNALKYESASYKKAVDEVNKKLLNATTKAEADAAVSSMVNDYKNINSQFNIDEAMIMKSIPKYSDKVYKNYPKLKLKEVKYKPGIEAGKYKGAPGKKDPLGNEEWSKIQYLSKAKEQQPRLLRGGNWFKTNFKWDGTASGMTDDMLKSLFNQMQNPNKLGGNTPIPSDFRTLLENSSKTTYSELRNVLSKAWGLTPVGLGALSQTDTKQKGGFKYETGGVNEFATSYPKKKEIIDISSLGAIQEFGDNISTIFKPKTYKKGSLTLRGKLNEPQINLGWNSNLRTTPFGGPTLSKPSYSGNISADLKLRKGLSLYGNVDYLSKAQPEYTAGLKFRFKRGGYKYENGGTETEEKPVNYRQHMMNYLSSARDTNQVNMVMNTISEHESFQDPKSIQVSGDKKTGFYDGPGRGLFQFENLPSGGGNTAMNRNANFLKHNTDKELKDFPNLYNLAKNTNIPDFSKLSKADQEGLFIGDKIFGGKMRRDEFDVLVRNRKTDPTSEDIFMYWLRNHKGASEGKNVLKEYTKDGKLYTGSGAVTKRVMNLTKEEIEIERKKWKERTKNMFNE